MFFSKNFDIHSIIHFVGSYTLVPTIMAIFGLPVMYASLLAVALGLCWEVLDEMNHVRFWRIKFLDARGGDIMDLIVDIAGILLAYWVF